MRLALTLLLCVSTISEAQENPNTIYGGGYADSLQIAVDTDAKKLSGYYNDGKCAFAFAGQLAAQAGSNGDTYEAQGWHVKHPNQQFSVKLYSIAQNGFSRQLTIETGDQRPLALKHCKWRVSLDRSYDVSISFIGIRVVRANKAPIFEIGQDGASPKLIRRKEKPPQAGSGIWVAKTYRIQAEPPGFVYANWYDPPGKPRGGYVSEKDLFSDNVKQASNEAIENVPEVISVGHDAGLGSRVVKWTISNTGMVQMFGEKCKGCAWHGPFSKTVTTSPALFEKVAALVPIKTLESAVAVPCATTEPEHRLKNVSVELTFADKQKSFLLHGDCNAREHIIVQKQLAAAWSLIAKKLPVGFEE